MKNSKFLNKNILITGASKGLGLACAESFYRAGANLFLNGRDEKNLKKLRTKNKKKINYYIGDLNDKFIFKEFIHEVKKNLKKIDVIIHCMGGGLGLKDALLKDEDFKILYDTNLGIASQINRLLINRFNKKESYIIHIGSTASIEAIGSVGYNTVKASVVAYVKSLAINLIKKNIFVSGVLPGAFIGKQNSFARLKKRKISAYNEFLNKKLPRNKIGKPSEIIPLIFLLSCKDGAMLAGSSISIDACETKAYNFF